MDATRTVAEAACKLGHADSRVTEIRFRRRMDIVE
jgi:hypothetical protein